MPDQTPPGRGALERVGAALAEMQPAFAVAQHTLTHAFDLPGPGVEQIEWIIGALRQQVDDLSELVETEYRALSA